MTGDKSKSTGLGVDSSGAPVVDPTANVLSLVEAAVKRLDDIAELRATFTERLIKAEAERIDTAAALRAEYTEKLSLAESRRIDAIRAVDVGAVAIASERAAQQASVLATQVATSAETLRALVATTAQTVAANLTSVSEQLIKRISTLEQSTWVGSGRSAISDPIQEEMVKQLRKLGESRDISVGSSSGSKAMWGYVAAAIGFLIGISGVVIAVIEMFKK